ncbi:MAG: 23S rRNA (adenine(2503)-C(2))-methyltransferase RlmN [Candidatus Binatia bacterium]|nr:23S rRNA (adenine(2503)-C(2))-methyltransferase RlmN [Candidatus Binatia bacterium]
MLTPRALRAWLDQRGEPAYRAEQVLSWVYRSGAHSFEELTNVPRSLRAALDRDFRWPAARLETVLRAVDDTRKLLLRFDDGATIECVVIPDPPRLTLCISSQVGCGMGCAFCATARLGLRRNLDSAEIIAQVLAARSVLRLDERLTNVVFMGMGEPLANYQNLVEAIEVLTAPWGFDLSGRRITVSTVGLLPQMERLVRETPVQLAVSLTAATDELRSELMPVNRRYQLEALIDVCRRLPLPQRRRVTFEYVLLAGINDRPQDAQLLAQLLRGVRAKVNLIPFNPFPGAPYARPTDDVVREFQEVLLARGVHTTVRRSRGLEVQAACGQLALSSQGQQTSVINMDYGAQRS